VKIMELNQQLNNSPQWIRDTSGKSPSS
jgi:hypothetical protein